MAFLINSLVDETIKCLAGILIKPLLPCLKYWPGFFYLTCIIPFYKLSSFNDGLV